ncbi:MAG: LCP family protein [Chloroflexota bacterium]
MQNPQPPRPRSRSAFAAAFLSLIFPGLGHAYAGAAKRALWFAAPPLLLLALFAGYALRVDKLELIGVVAQPSVLAGIFVGNVALAVYRVVAAIDAWRVARFLNGVEAAGDGRAGRPRLPISPISVAGLAAVVLVLLGGHAVVARYDMLALTTVNCTNIDTTDESCDEPAASPDASGQDTDPSSAADSGDAVPSPIGSASGSVAPSASLPPWNGKDRLNILLIGSDQRPNEGTWNTDTLIVVSVDPKTHQVAMFQVPRDATDVPVPPNAQSVWGSTYGAKINSWFTANRNRGDLWPGNSRARGYNALKAILGNLYGLDIRYFVEVNFNGFKNVVDTLGGVNINVQVPVSDDRFPGDDGTLRRVYIASGPQHMDGTQALIYARSRHSTNDFDRGRRQQRVLLSIRQQTDIQTIVKNLEPLTNTFKQSVRTDIPPSMYSRLLGLASGIDIKNVRSFVFAPPLYGSETPPSAPVYHLFLKVDRIRSAVRNAFSADPQLETRREDLANEAANVWVLNGSGRVNQAAGVANYLEYNGIAASAPTQRPRSTLSNTKIVVYNDAQADDTVAYLEKLFGVKSTTATDPTVPVDIVVTTGRNTKDLSPPTSG